MNFIFNGSPSPTLGVEVELQILDPTTLDLTPQSEMLLEKAQVAGLERVKAEVHQSMLEVDTSICATVSQCRNCMQSSLTLLHQLAQENDVLIAISGTHAFQRWTDRILSDDSRYHALHKKFQWLIRRMNVYGLHVHVGIKSGDEAIAIINDVVKYLPHLLALSANSPYWQGIDTGMQTSRINMIESFPFAGIPKLFNNWSELEHYYLTLKKSGAIHSMKDLYWFVRPNLEFGTVEFRICDASSSIEETMAIVALIQCLVVYSNRNLKTPKSHWSLEHQWIAPENLWRAARDGLDAQLISPEGKQVPIKQEIEALIIQLIPIAEELSCKDELISISRILSIGNGATKQRRTYINTGNLKEVVRSSLLDNTFHYTEIGL